ncbi:MAG: cytochrome c3 family protein, partial [Myxococcaceae bacterium]
MAQRLFFVAVIGAALFSGAAVAGPTPRPKEPEKPAAKVKAKPGSLAPLAATEKVEWSHGPYEAADCSLCHKNKDPKNPGPLAKPTNELCLSCHEEFEDILKRKFKHPPVQDSCTHCHNPHNARKKKLLLDEPVDLCLGCHPEISKLATGSRVKHQPVTSGAACANCHNPHGANVEHLLVKLPFDLCVGCHDREQTDPEGKKLVNFKKLLEENPKWHGPVAAKDCSACHRPHGGDEFRLLVNPYPAKFYSPYDPRNYALCFECHDESMVKDAQTTTLTSFRDGKRNLHFLHVNKADLGRTCRACHDVHAARQDHIIRDGVPYGSKGWVLKLNY